MAQHPLIVKVNNFYTKLKKRERLFLFITIGFVFFAFVDMAVLGPIFSQLKMLDAEIEAKSQTIMRNQRILSFKNSILKDYAKYSNYLASPKSEEQVISEHLQEIENLAKAQQVNINKIDSGDKRENPLNKEYDINVDCEGTLGNILAFMNQLEDSEMLFEIRKYKLNPKSKEGDLIKASLTITRILVLAETPPEVEKPETLEKSDKTEKPVEKTEEKPA